MEQAERRFVYRRSLQRIDRVLLHQRLQAFGDRRLAAAHRTEQVQDLLAFFQTLRRVAEEGDDLGDRVVHAVEPVECRVALDHAVGKQSRQTWIVARVDHLGLADRGQHALGGGGIGERLVAAKIEILGQRHLFMTPPDIRLAIRIEQVHVTS